MPRGRKPQSQIRQNMVELLFFMKKAHGYDIFKVYSKIFPRVSMRSIYYHLRKGAELGEFEISNIAKEAGEYTWGDSAERVYYKLGRQASPKADKRVKNYFNKEVKR